MQIPIVTNQKYEQNFTGFYRVRHTNGTFMDLLKNQVVPLYEITTRKPTYIFQGNGPFDVALENTIREQIEKEGYSYKWFIHNAKNFGINLPNFDDIDTWVVTGAKDIESLAPLFKRKKTSILSNFIDKVKRIITILNQDNNLPDHIRRFSSIVKRNEKLVQDFKNLIADKKVVEVDNLQNLIKNMVLER